jgi:5-methylcytosine-specific restriction endonuclease McrA
MNLRESSDETLLAAVATLVGSQRELTAKLVAHLAEIEERRLHLVAGFSSMFDFCQQKLGMSEGEAFRRILAARLSRRFPLVLSLLASGSVNLSTLELVRERVTDENHEELLAAVARMSKREVQTYLASRFPRADEPSRIRALASIEPLSEGRFKVEFTASAELREKLELCRDLMSHANPSRDLAEVVERAVDLLLEKLRKERLGHARKPRTAARGAENDGSTRASRAVRETSVTRASSTARETRVTRATRRRVFERDGVRCTYVSPEGRRCEARAFLELDHVLPKAHGGESGAANLRVRCRAHNQLWAAQVFGLETVERARHFRQQKRDGEGQALREALLVATAGRG